MAVNEQNQDRRKSLAIGRISSQAGLNAFAGGRAKSLPSVPAPGQPGSRFNAVVVDRGERMSREEGVKAPRAKSLPLNMPPGMIQGVPSAIMNPARDKEQEQTVAGAAAQGFAGGFIAGAQNRMFGASGGGEQEGTNPSWQANNQEAVAFNAKIMAATAETIALMDRDIETMTDPADIGARFQLIAARAQVVESLKTMQESMAHDQVNVDVRSGAHTDADVQTLRQQLSQLHEANGQMRASQLQRGDAARQPAAAPSAGRTAPVRNADGMTLADLTAMAPGEDPLPGMSQPLIMDVLNEVQGTPPVRTAAVGAKRSARSAVMNADHVAALKELDRGGDDLEMAGSIYGR